MDDVVGLVEYSAAISIALAALSGTGGFQVGNILKPILINGAVLVLGGIFGWLLKCMMPKKKYKDNRLIISVAALFAFAGSVLWQMYPLFWDVCPWEPFILIYLMMISCLNS